MREQRAIVAVVQDTQKSPDNRVRFLVTYNTKWDGYAFPMTALPDDENVLGSLAIQAVERDLGCRLPHATATELDYVGRVGISERTKEYTLYGYWLFTVVPNQPLDLSAALKKPVPPPQPPLFLTYDELRSRTDLTWSTDAIAHEFVANQDAVLAVVTRPGANETEFLLVFNENYGGFFFPTQRVKSEVKPEPLAVATVRSDLGYRGPESGPVAATLLGEIPNVHSSKRFGLERRYRFHVCGIQLEGIDLTQPGNAFERALAHRGRNYRWVPGSQLPSPGVPLSETMDAVRPTVLSLFPSRS